MIGLCWVIFVTNILVLKSPGVTIVEIYATLHGYPGGRGAFFMTGNGKIRVVNNLNRQPHVYICSVTYCTVYVVLMYVRVQTQIEEQNLAFILGHMNYTVLDIIFRTFIHVNCKVQICLKV